MEKTIDLLMEYLDEIKGNIQDYSIAVGYGYDYEEACLYRQRVLERLNEKQELTELPIYQIGATIGVHTGPYPIGVGIIRKSL